MSRHVRRPVLLHGPPHVQQVIISFIYLSRRPEEDIDEVQRNPLEGQGLVEEVLVHGAAVAQEGVPGVLDASHLFSLSASILYCFFWLAFPTFFGLFVSIILAFAT